MNLPSLSRVFTLTALAGTAAFANETTQTLPPVQVIAPRVANEAPAGTFSMPITSLRFEPLVDAQGRNLAEAQADVIIRGGTFENTGFNLGALPLYDPQTGHYFAELPVAPAMLGSPEIRTGSSAATQGWNATAGSIAYTWSPIRSGGFTSAGFGDHGLARGELYSGFVSPLTVAGRTLAADFSLAGSSGHGTRPFGEHTFERYNLRLQLANARSQTDLFTGYQAKFFGWPNLYTAPTAIRNETENLKTRLYLLNHRVELDAPDSFFQFGASHRRHSDLYVFDRTFAPPPGFVPFKHETLVTTFSADGRTPLASLRDTRFGLRYRAGLVADSIDSDRLSKLGDGLGTGRFNHRTQAYAGLHPDFVHDLGDGRAFHALLGLNFDYSNRDRDAFSPLAELAYAQTSGFLRRTYVSYTQSTQLPTYTALNSAPVGLFGGNPNLGRSRAQNFELGLDTAPSPWSLRTAVFFRRDRDLVDWTFSNPSPNTRQANAVDIDTFGLELVARRDFERLGLVLGYTYLTKDASYTTPGADASFYALNFARHRLTAAFIVQLLDDLELRLDNELRLQAPNRLRTSSDQAYRNSLGLLYRPAFTPALTLEARIDNLTKSNFEEVPGVPPPRRQASLGATYTW